MKKLANGYLRHVVIKLGIKTKEVMCILVNNARNIPKEEELVEFLKQQFLRNEILKEYELKTIVKNINCKNTNVILGNENIILYGKGHIYDKLGNYTFKISPMSFFQTNPTQTEILYRKAIEFANLTGNETVLDLYCGTGTIGIFASSKSKKVYGIEIVEDAVKDAKENAILNNINNIEFLCGDVEKILESLLTKSGKPDVIFVDPPRRGLDGKTIKNVLKVEPKKIVYISCNPATMVRDLKLLNEKYNVIRVQPVDMFPYTSHVETVSLLALKTNV